MRPMGLKNSAPLRFDTVHRRKPIYFAMIALLAAIAFFLSLGSTDIVTSHEARVAQTARLMAATGWPWSNAGVDVPAIEFYRDPNGRKYFRHTVGQPPIHVNPWLIPVAAGEVRLQKPPLPYWFAAIFYRIFHFNEFYSRLPSALMGFAATFLMMDLARRLISNKAAIWAGLIWISTLFVIDSYRKTMADPGLAFFTLLCFWSWIRFARGESLWLLLLFYLSLAMGMFAKGPVIYLHLFAAITMFSYCYRQWPRGRQQWIWHLLGTALVLAIFLPWPLHVIHRVPHALELWRYESIGEFLDNIEDARPWWFYLPNVFLIPAPWTLVGMIGAADVIRRTVKRRSPGCASGVPIYRKGLFPLLWIALTVFIFSFSNLKKNMYLLPMMPAMVLLCVQGVFTLSAYLRVRRLRGIAITVQIGMAVAAMAIACLGIRSIPSLLIVAPAAALGIFAMVSAWYRDIHRWLIFQSAAGALAVTAFLVYHMSDRDNLRSARPLADAAMPLLSVPDIAFHNIPIEVSVYLPLDLPVRANAPRQLIFTRTLREGPDAYQNQTPDQRIVKAEPLHFANIPKVNPWKVVLLTVEPN
jgi:4-amino-4-deoxy-L-arabinose transferase-like glycosyltransferase